MKVKGFFSSFSKVTMSIESFPATNIATKFADFRERGLFIDCQFVIPDTEEIVKCHRIILSHFSPLFKQFFTDSSFSATNKSLEIPFFINGETFKSIIDFLYSHKIEINEKTMINRVFQSSFNGYLNKNNI